MTPRGDTYEEVRQAIDDARSARGERSRQGDDDSDGRWPAWVQTALAVLAVIVAVVLAYSALDKRIALIEQALNEQGRKLEQIYQQGRQR